jgi:Zn-dependent peptidase ImmA (M78 family)
MKVNICGIPHTVIECEDHFDVDTHFGQIDYKACEIMINENMATEAKEETICHEMVHGILVHLGYSEQSQDETFVQALANAIYQGFDIRIKE